MMINFNLIQNQELRALLMASTSIKTLQEKAANDFLAQITKLPGDKISQLIAALKEESAQMAAIEAKQRALTSEKVKENDAILKKIEKELGLKMMRIDEKKSRAEDEANSENLLKNL